MNIQVIGTGAAGNANGILLLKKGLIKEDDLFLVNSTAVDVPDEFKNKVYVLNKSVGGCGKETSLSKQLTLNALKNGTLGEEIKKFLKPETEQVMIVSSTEGGSGSGSANILGNWTLRKCKVPTQIFAFTGFEQDTRGLQNTIEFFQELNEGFTVQSISNAKFLDKANGNMLKAEELANLEFLRRFSIMKGLGMIHSKKNMDAMDLFKLVVTPGYLISGHANLDKFKNIDQFNKFISNFIDENASLETKPSSGRLGVIINADPDLQQNIDYSFKVFEDKFGVPYESFPHIQYDEKQPNNYISFIASGLKMPLDVLKETYDKYKEQSEKSNKEKDDFFDFMGDLKGNPSDSMFNLASSKLNIGNAEPEKDDDDFFKQYEKPKSNFSNTVSNKVQQVIQNSEDDTKKKY